jgi:hypothetical protein
VRKQKNNLNMFSKIAKTKMYITVATIALSMAVASIFIACNKGQSTDAELEAKAKQKLERVSKWFWTCCEITCPKGSCYSNTSPCECSCLPGGGAKCAGGASSATGAFDGIVWITTAEQFNSYTTLINYLRVELGAAEAADAMQNIQDLFATNDWVLSTPDAVGSYYENLQIYEDFCNTQTEDVLERLNNL